MTFKRTQLGTSGPVKMAVAGMSLISLCGFGPSVRECSNQDVIQNYKSQFSNVAGLANDISPSTILNDMRVSVQSQTSDSQRRHFKCTAVVSLGRNSHTIHYLLTLNNDRTQFKVIPMLKPTASATWLNCERATDPSDKLVCSDPELMKKDSDLATLYNQDRVEAVANDGDVQRVDLYPRDWRTERRSCGTNSICTRWFYDQKQSMLKVFASDAPRWKFYATIAALGWIFLVAYAVPTVIALIRRHPKRGKIAALNLLFGWTIVGWIAAVIWARRPIAQNGDIQ